MSLPEPHPGLVIRYTYLWYRERSGGREAGSKDRPAAILMASMTRTGIRRVFVLPITHSAPAPGDAAIEIPPAVKHRLGLDGERSWIVLDELNEFLWPGFDLAPIPGSEPPAYSYGTLPPAFYDTVRDAFLKEYESRRVKSVKRD